MLISGASAWLDAKIGIDVSDKLNIKPVKPLKKLFTFIHIPLVFCLVSNELKPDPDSS